MNTHKFGVDSNYLVKRRLLLAGVFPQNGTAITDAIAELIGVDTVTLDLATGSLDVHYDASKRHLDDIVEIIRHEGSMLSMKRWQRFKRGWYRYFDQNIKENAVKQPWRCH